MNLDAATLIGWAASISWIAKKSGEIELYLWPQESCDELCQVHCCHDQQHCTQTGLAIKLLILSVLLLAEFLYQHGYAGVPWFCWKWTYSWACKSCFQSRSLPIYWTLYSSGCLTPSSILVWAAAPCAYALAPVMHELFLSSSVSSSFLLSGGFSSRSFIKLFW